MCNFRTISSMYLDIPSWIRSLLYYIQAFYYSFLLCLMPYHFSVQLLEILSLIHIDQIEVKPLIYNSATNQAIIAKHSKACRSTFFYCFCHSQEGEAHQMHKGKKQGNTKQQFLCIWINRTWSHILLVCVHSVLGLDVNGISSWPRQTNC